MRPTTPPRLATTLLARFVDNDALAGDLQEEYRSGRSAAWYWRQVVAAVVIAALRRGDWHELFAAQGLVMQWVMLGLVSVCAVFTVKVTAWLLRHEGIDALLQPSALREFGRVALAFAIALVVGAAIARIHLRSRGAAVLAFSTAVTAWTTTNLYLLDGAGTLNALTPHVVAALVFVAGMLAGGLHGDLVMPPRRTIARS
jgi:hypothetical protein